MKVNKRTCCLWPTSDTNPSELAERLGFEVARGMIRMPPGASAPLRSPQEGGIPPSEPPVQTPPTVASIEKNSVLFFGGVVADVVLALLR